MLQNWFRTFVYHFKNSKAFSLLTIIGLALGISGVIFAVLYWDDEHSYDAWNPNKDNIYQVSYDMGDLDIWANNTAPIAPVAKMKIPEIEDFCYLDGWYVSENIEFEGKKIIATKTIEADSSFFKFFPFEFIYGNPKTALKEKNSIAISENIAKQLFGEENPIDKTVKYYGEAFTVKGVYKPNPKSSYAPNVVCNNIFKRLEKGKDDWSNYNYYLFLKIKEGSNIKKITKTLYDLVEENTTARFARDEGIPLEEYIEEYGDIKPVLQPLSELRLHSVGEDFLPEGRGNYQMLLIMLGLSILILILSVVNYINLATANAIKRAKEIGIRKIVGATKTQIVLQFLFETTIYLLISFLLALSIVELGLPFYNNFLKKEMALSLLEFLPSLLQIFVITLFLAGVLPAFYVSNFESLKALKGSFSNSKKGVWLRNSMLVLQFSIASIFIVGSFIVREQVRFMNTKDLGFKGEQVIMMDYTKKTKIENPHEKYRILKNDLKQINGVLDVSVSNLEIGYGVGSSTSVTSISNKKIVQSQITFSETNFFDVLDIKIINGRNYSDHLATDTISSILINKSASDGFGFKNPIGEKIDFWGKNYEIIGVVDDFNIKGFREKVQPMVFPHFSTRAWLDKVYIKINPEQTEHILKELENYWNQNITTEYPFSYDFADKAFARTYQEYITQNRIFTVLNIVVVCIALFGLFALASYSMERRMKEISIRKTLGASVQILLKNLTLQYVIFCVIGFALSVVPTYMLLQKWLENFAYRIDISFVPFVIGFFVLMVLTLIIVLSKAYQATQVDVLKYLKYE